LAAREATLGIRNLFTKRADDVVTGTKVLIASLNSKFTELAHADSRCYSQFYPNTTEHLLDNAEELSGAIKGYDVLHLFCDVTPAGNIADGRGREIPAAKLIESCCRCDVKLLWLASENKPEGYIKGFKAGGKPLNLVLTIDRKNSRFSSFLENILLKMSAGETMPSAWVALVPQHANDPRAQAAPACIFAAGRASVRLR
jgi:hypothetical protein